jgi:hypothetical protein
VWARSFYGEAKMGRAVERYGQEETPEPDPRMTVLAAEIAEHDAPG